MSGAIPPFCICIHGVHRDNSFFGQKLLMVYFPGDDLFQPKHVT